MAAFVTLHAPSAVFPHSEWFDGGIRLLRDDHELNYYFQHVSAPASQQGYPPLAVLYFSLPRLFTRDFTSYENIFVAMNALLYAALVTVVAVLLEGEGQKLRRVLLFALPGFVYFSLWRFDVLPALLVVTALLAVKKKSPEPAFVLLIVAGAVKWYPLLFLPAFFIHFVATSADGNAQKRFQKGLLWMLGIGAGFALVASAIMGPSALIDPILFHLSRDFEIAAFGTVLLLIVENLFRNAAPFHVLLARIATIAQFAAVIPILWKGFPKDFRSMVRACVFVLIPFIALGPVFSAQWIIWLTPLLLPVAEGSELAMLAGLDFAVYLQYPVQFGIDPYAFAFFSLTVIRTALFATLWWKSFRALFPSVKKISSRPLFAPSKF